MTASNRLLWPAVEALRVTGADVSRTLAAVGLTEDLAYAPDTRIRMEQLHAVWRTAVERTGDPALGVKLAVFSNPAGTVSWPMPLSLLEHLGMSAATLEDALILQNRFLRLLRDGLRVQTDIDGEQCITRLELLPDEPPVLVELTFAVAVNLARRVARRMVPLREVWFTHKTPPDLAPYTAAFGCPVRFAAPFNAIFGSVAEFRKPLGTGSEVFRRRIVQQAEKFLSALPSLDFFEDRVCSQIEAELPGGNTNAAAVAEKLGVSARTLHRRLHQEGTSYQDLLDRVRFRLAVRHLGAGRTVAEVAHLVGFAQASTFHRAFKSWTGETPAEYQEHHGVTVRDPDTAGVH
jgi:AraC-like DNA-binding protein